MERPRPCRWVAVAVAAATAFAAGRASAAELPDEPRPVDYVRVCDAYGSGYLAIPGSSTCVSMFGYVQAEYMVFDSNRASRQPGWYSNKRPGTIFRGRVTTFIYTVTETEYGPVKSYYKIEYTEDNQSLDMEYKEAYIQAMGFTAGRTQSLYSYYTGNTFEDYYEPAWSDWQINVLGYTADFGHGLTATVGLEDATTRDLAIVFGRKPGSKGNGYAPPLTPDAVANLALTADWGSAQIMGALHHLRAERGSAGAAIGYALGGGATFNLPFLGDGDSIAIEGNFTHGALSYAANNPVGPGPGFIGADAMLVRGGRSLDLATAWSVGGGLTHNWTDKLSSVLEASYLEVDLKRPRYGFTNIDVQANLIYEPVDKLQVGIEAEYKYIGRRRADAGRTLMTMFVIERDF